MKRMYVSLSLAVSILSFQAISMDNSIARVASDSAVEQSESYTQNEREDAILGCSDSPLESAVGDNTVFAWLRIIRDHNDGVCSKTFGEDAETNFEKCAELTALRQQLIQIRAFMLLRAPDNAITGYKIKRLLEFNHAIMLPNIATLLERKYTVIGSRPTEKDELDILLTDYTNRRGFELLRMFKPFEVKQEIQEGDNINEQHKKDKIFLKSFIENFLSYYHKIIHPTYVKNLSSMMVK